MMILGIGNQQNIGKIIKLNKKNKKKKKKMISDREKRQRFNRYKESHKSHLLTSRFTNDTWNENELFREKNNNIKCVYCSPDLVQKDIPLNRNLFILEMNNSKNEIMGIGMVVNHAICNKYKIYSKENYNRYVYIGKNRIDKIEMSEKEKEIIEALEILCFKGNRHMKRSQGLKSFPLKMLYNIYEGTKIDLILKIGEMFKTRLRT